MPINKFLSFTKKMLKPFKKLSKDSHVPTGKAEPGGAVPNPPERAKENADFRQVGKSPDDKSGYPVQHLGDKK